MIAERLASHDPEFQHDGSGDDRTQTVERLRYYARRLDEIELRLEELEDEWTVERTFQVKMGAWALIGAVGGTVWKPANILAAAAGVLLLQDALLRRCAMKGLFEYAGFRTRAALENERLALKALRGDFVDSVPKSPSDAEPAVIRAWEAANR